MDPVREELEELQSLLDIDPNEKLKTGNATELYISLISIELVGFHNDQEKVAEEVTLKEALGMHINSIKLNNDPDGSHMQSIAGIRYYKELRKILQKAESGQKLHAARVIYNYTKKQGPVEDKENFDSLIKNISPIVFTTKEDIPGLLKTLRPTISEWKELISAGDIGSAKPENQSYYFDHLGDNILNIISIAGKIATRLDVLRPNHFNDTYSESTFVGKLASVLSFTEKDILLNELSSYITSYILFGEKRIKVSILKETEIEINELTTLSLDEIRNIRFYLDKAERPGEDTLLDNSKEINYLPIYRKRIRRNRLSKKALLGMKVLTLLSFLKHSEKLLQGKIGKVNSLLTEYIESLNIDYHHIFFDGGKMGKDSMKYLKERGIITSTGKGAGTKYATSPTTDIGKEITAILEELERTFDAESKSGNSSS